MNKLICTLLLLTGLSAPAAVKYYDDYPNNANPPSTFILSIQTLDKSVGGTPYNYFTLGQMSEWLGTQGFTNGGTIIVSNASFQFITNLYAYLTNIYSTNIVAQNITNTTFVTTNVTINVPGGLTSLNATPKTVAWWDANDTLLYIPNSSGFLTNNGSGDIGWSTVLALTELDAQNAYLTNTFLFLTNSPYLATDGDGKAITGTGLSPTNVLLVAGANVSFTTNAGGSVTVATSATATNTTTIVQNLSATYITNNTLYTTNAYFVTGKGNTLIITNVSVENSLTNKGVAASSIVATDSNQVETNAVLSARLSFTANTLDLTATPYANSINFTNLGYGLPTNNVGGAALVFGGPGTAAILYDTNITAATTLKLFDITACGATAGGFKLYCTCSGGTDRILTFPAGCSGAGLGKPPAVTITNAKGAFFDVIYKPGATPVTNVFWSPVY